MGKEGREAHGKGGSRGEHPALVVMGVVGAGRWAGGAMGWMGWERAWCITHHPQLPPGRGAGPGASRGGSTARQNQLSAQGVTDQPLGSLPSEGQRRASSFVAS